MYVIDINNKEIKHSETSQLQVSRVISYLRICVLLTRHVSIFRQKSKLQQGRESSKKNVSDCSSLNTWCSKNILRRRKQVFKKHITRMIHFPTALSNLPLLALGNGKMRYIVEYWHVNNARMFDSPNRYTEVEHFMKKNVDYKR